MKAESTSLQKNFYWIYLIGFFLILALPLLNLPPWFSPPDWGKTIVFRTILSVLIFLSIYQILYQKTDDRFPAIIQKILSKKSSIFWPFWLLMALLGINFLATIFSLDANFSFWGSPYRSGGFVNFAFYIFFAVLLIFILRPKDWKKIWDFVIGVGVLVSAIAVFQQFGIFSKIFIFFEDRPPSTIGGPIFLAIYLLLLSFLTLTFAVKEKKKSKKLFYFGSLILFILVAVLITQTRAALLGFLAGFLYFLVFYPQTKKNLALILKITALIIVSLGIFGFYYINTQDELPSFFGENKFFQKLIPRLQIETVLEGSRLSGWQVSLEAVKERPILGYGPENFSTAFDKYYDPSLPGLERATTATSYSWWDRAHNFIFDISVTAGIPALIIYLALFCALFFALQKLKSANQALAAHGIQATFIAYLTANFFSFDTFSTYLISFLIIGYSLHLISQHKEENSGEQFSAENLSRVLFRRRKPIIILLFLGLIWSIWSFNIKPFQINTQINTAKYLVENKNCQDSLLRLDDQLKQKSFLNDYLRLKYVDLMMMCQTQHPEKNLEYAQKGTELLKENIKIRPNFTRNWLLLGGFTTVLIEKEPNPEKRQEFIAEARNYLEKAWQLSPKRQEVVVEQAKTELVAKEYQKAKEKTKKCVKLNSNLADCYWYLGLSEIFLGNIKEGKKNIEIALEKDYREYRINPEVCLGQLANAYSAAQSYQELANTYLELIELKPQEPQYHASLAFTYRELGQFEKAQKEALKVLELQPEARAEVEMFLKTLTAD